METIKKDVCLNRTLTKKEFVRVYIFLILVEVLLLGLFWWRIGNLFLLLSEAVLFVVFDVWFLYNRIKKPLGDETFYLVEDTFVSARETRVFTDLFQTIRWCQRRWHYTIKFSRHGTYEVMFFSKKEPEKTDPDYSAVFFSKPGDRFYLLMSQNKKEEKIIQSFNAKYYKLAEEEFDYVEGNYYPKV